MLTLAQQIAVESINADIARLQRKMRAVLQEAGLDPDSVYSINADGVVTVKT